MRVEVNDEQYSKTVFCHFYAEGACRKGSECSFAHGFDELQSKPDFTKTSLCLGWLSGGCCLPSRECTFAHGREELRTVGVLGNELSQVRRRRRPAEPQNPKSPTGSQSRQKLLTLHPLLVPPSHRAEVAGLSIPHGHLFNDQLLEKLLREAQPEYYED